MAAAAAAGAGAAVAALAGPALRALALRSARLRGGFPIEIIFLLIIYSPIPQFVLHEHWDCSGDLTVMVLRATKLWTVQLTPRRWLNLQEYQSKKIMADHGVTVQRFFVADSANDALEAAQRLKNYTLSGISNEAPTLENVMAKKHLVRIMFRTVPGRCRQKTGNSTCSICNAMEVSLWYFITSLLRHPKTVEQLAKQMIGYNLSTKQTPKDGVTVKKVMVAEALDISRETYFAILMDRACNGPVMVGSPQGGVDIEEVAVTSPELIFKEEIDIFEGIKDRQALQMAKNLGFQGALQQQAADQIKKLYNLFLKIDATQVEVNPFGETPEGQVVCFDAKINFDDNAEFRQKEIFAMDDKSENEPIENEAAKYDLKYIGLDGNIACFVNGAGLAMATCDIISLNGGKPANFLDLGGGVKEAQVYQAFKLLTKDPKLMCTFAQPVWYAVLAAAVLQKPFLIIEGNNKANTLPFVMTFQKTNEWLGGKVMSCDGGDGGEEPEQGAQTSGRLIPGSAQGQVEAILVNIFGGIVNCAVIANGITKACRELELKVPLVVRLEGTNVHEAQRILSESGLPITSASDLEDAARKAVACVARK
ncbi:Succinyl-CoA ligase [Willisornis vidua]|uniref:Succinyl-CoA ligase n=1 Tax=Willisornis vidua TaxID=1566151 RepID=A0ABQ9DIZ0_9PASS|nr:Succinyl-CoA ligase [Willisornis vidua]